MMKTAEHVVLIDDDGESLGTELKSRVHTAHTPLHLGFSCHVLNIHGQVLTTRRSLHKRTWPGVWTNSFCGHPQPAETVEDAVRRHAWQELGLELSGLRSVLPDFRYYATDSSGTVENEICPVFIGEAESTPQMNPEEVAEMRWVWPEQLSTALRTVPWAFSPWLVSQAKQMPLYGGNAGTASSARDRP